MGTSVNSEDSDEMPHTAAHARIQKVLPEGSNSDNVFFSDNEGENPNTTKSGPSSTRERNAI